TCGSIGSTATKWTTFPRRSDSATSSGPKCRVCQRPPAKPETWDNEWLNDIQPLLSIQADNFMLHTQHEFVRALQTYAAQKYHEQTTEDAGPHTVDLGRSGACRCGKRACSPDESERHGRAVLHCEPCLQRPVQRSDARRYVRGPPRTGTSRAGLLGGNECVEGALRVAGGGNASF